MGANSELTGTYTCTATATTGDLLSTGAAFLVNNMLEHASTTITYVRGSDTVDLSAVVGDTKWDITSVADGAVVTWESRDYIVRAADILLAAGAVTPQRGDIIRETRGGITYIYEVLSPAGEAVYATADHGRYSLRIHTKLKGIS